MSWFKNIFAKKKNNGDEIVPKETEMLRKLESSVKNCKDEISKAENELEHLRKWAIDAIRECFEVPHQFWYEEFEKYQEIKELSENMTVDDQVINKCDEIVQGYLDQIALRKAKINLYNGLIEKYEDSKKKIMILKNKRDNQDIAKTKLQALEKHTKRLEQLQVNPENISQPVEESTQLEIINDEVNEVFEDYEISEEVRKHMTDLNKQFQTTHSGFDSKAAIKEIEELLNRIKKQ